MPSPARFFVPLLLCALLVMPAWGQNQFLDATSHLPTVDDHTDAVVLGDVDGDGDLDLVIGNARQQNRLCLNDGSGRFTDVTDTHLPVDSDSTTSLALGDIDGDGDLDLVVGNGGGFYLTYFERDRVYINNGHGVFTDAPDRIPDDRRLTSALALGDLDGDGDLDLVLATTARDRLYLNTGGTFHDRTATHMPAIMSNSQDMAMGDVDGDGDLDLFFANGMYFGSEADHLYLNDGAARFTDVTATHLPRELFQSGSVAIGDVDGDGDNDLAIGGGAQAWEDPTLILLNDGQGVFGLSPCYPHFGQTFATVLHDIDEDGDLDLVSGDRIHDSRLTVNDGSGAGCFENGVVIGPLITVHSMAMGDVDGDGDADLVVGTGGLPWLWQNRLLVNRHRQLWAPAPPVLGGTYALEFHAEPGYAASSHTGFGFLGFEVLGVPLPVPGLGTLFLDPALLSPLPPVAIPPTTGAGTLQIPVPAHPPLQGLEIYAQGLIVNDSTGDARLTGYTADTIQ